MFKLIGFVFRVSFFAVIVLILGNWLKWDSKTISDQVKTRMSHAERSEIVSDVRDWAGRITNDVRKGARNHASQNHVSKNKAPEDGENIPSSERQKLRDLIRELNGSR